MIGLIIGAVAAAAGIGMQIMGGQEQEAAAKKQAALAAKAAKKEKKIINKRIIPLMQQESDLDAKAAAESAAAEALRKQQMELDASRTRREVIRNAVMARANTLSAAANQGAQGSSGFFGALNQMTSQENRQLGGIFQNLSIGRGIFEHNASMAEFLTQENKLKTEENIQRTKLGTVLNQSQAKIQAAGISGGGTLSAIGSTLVGSAGTISQLGTSALFGKSTPPPAGT